MFEGAVQVGGGFLVDDDGVGARRGKRLDKILGRRDHQVGFDDQPRERPQGADSNRSKGDIGNEAAIHYVHLKAVHSCRFHLLHLLAEAGEIRRKNRWGYFDLQVSPPGMVNSK
jgi:hypothetical protein